MQSAKINIGVLLALMAALFNGSVGTISKLGFDTGVHFSSICFFRTLGAFIFLSVFFVDKHFLANVKQLVPRWKQLAICSFFGSFMLSFFSTFGFYVEKIPTVSIMIYAGGILTVILGVVVLKEACNVKKILSMLLIFLGSFVILSVGGISLEDDLGVIFALIAGTSYALFIFLWKRYSLPASFASLWYLFMFSTVYMFVPYAYFGMQIPTIDAMPYVLLLVFFPAIAGFYCTMSAVNYTEASKVQIVETTDPLFSVMFAFLVFQQVLVGAEIIGAVLVLLGLVLITVRTKEK